MNEAEEPKDTTLDGKQFHCVVVLGKNELMDCVVLHLNGLIARELLDLLS